MSRRFDPSLHPRGHHGKFIKKLGGADVKAISGSKAPVRAPNRKPRTRTQSAVHVPQASRVTTGVGAFDIATGRHHDDITSKANLPGLRGVKVGPGRVSGRIGMRSATVAYGKDIQLGPNYNLHLATLARIEKTGNKKTYLEKLRTKVLMSLADKIPNAKLREHAENIIRSRSTKIGKTNVGVGKTGIRTSRVNGNRPVLQTRRRTRARPTRTSMAGSRVRR